MLNVDAVERELCYVTKEDTEQIRLGSGHTKVIFKDEQIRGL